MIPSKSVTISDLESEPSVIDAPQPVKITDEDGAELVILDCPQGGEVCIKIKLDEFLCVRLTHDQVRAVMAALAATLPWSDLRDVTTALTRLAIEETPEQVAARGGATMPSESEKPMPDDEPLRKIGPLNEAHAAYITQGISSGPYAELPVAEPCWCTIGKDHGADEAPGDEPARAPLI